MTDRDLLKVILDEIRKNFSKSALSDAIILRKSDLERLQRIEGSFTLADESRG